MIEEIIFDHSQHRFHRMYWMRAGPNWPREDEDTRAQMIKELDRISQDHPGDLATQSAVRVTRKQIEHRMEFRRKWCEEHPPRLW